ncbi:MAG: glycosyltransferase [Clostridia bacterium]
MSGSWDGGERGLIAHTIATLLAGLGHHLTYWPLSSPRHFSVGGMHEVLEAPAGKGLGSRLQFLGQLRRGLRSFDAILVEQDLAVEFTVAEVVLGLRSRPLLILLAHYPLGYYLAGRGEHNIARERKLAARILPRFDQIITLAPSVGEDLTEHFGVPKERVHSLLWPAPAKAGRRPSQGSSIAIVGHITGMKGVDVFLNTLGHLQEPHSTPDVHVFGDGDAVETVVREAAEHGIRLEMAPLTPNIVEDLAASANLFYGPQWMDGTAFDYVVAAAAGLPLAGLAAPTAPADILLSGTMGRLAGLGEVAESGRHVVEFMEDRRVYGGFQGAAAMLYGRHTPDRVSSDWAALFPG